MPATSNDDQRVAGRTTGNRKLVWRVVFVVGGGLHRTPAAPHRGRGVKRSGAWGQIPARAGGDGAGGRHLWLERGGRRRGQEEVQEACRRPRQAPTARELPRQQRPAAPPQRLWPAGRGGRSSAGCPALECPCRARGSIARAQPLPPVQPAARPPSRASAQPHPGPRPSQTHAPPPPCPLYRHAGPPHAAALAAVLIVALMPVDPSGKGRNWVPFADPSPAGHHQARGGGGAGPLTSKARRPPGPETQPAGQAVAGCRGGEGLGGRAAAASQ